MQAFQHNLIALALGAILVSPAVLAKGPPSGQVGGNINANAHVGVTVPDRASDPAANHPDKGNSVDAKASVNTNANMSDEAQNPPGKGNWWTDADSNGDGKISTAEATANAGLSSRFGIVDTNKDGFVTMAEYRDFYTSTASQGETHAAAHSAVVTRDVWVRLDADTDGRISSSEAAADTNISGSFAVMDADHDGFITQEEYVAYEKAHK